MIQNGAMDKPILDARVATACVVWGAHLERAADAFARQRLPGLNSRDVLLLATLAYDRDGEALPSQLIGPVFTTAPGVSGSLRRLEAVGLVTRGVGTDQRTRPVDLTDAGRELVAGEMDAWAEYHDERLSRLDAAERAELYRLLVKGSGLWDDTWARESATED